MEGQVTRWAYALRCNVRPNKTQAADHERESWSSVCAIFTRSQRQMWCHSMYRPGPLHCFAEMCFKWLWQTRRKCRAYRSALFIPSFRKRNRVGTGATWWNPIPILMFSLLFLLSLFHFLSYFSFCHPLSSSSSQLVNAQGINRTNNNKKHLPSND